MIYLDNAATTQIDETVLGVMSYYQIDRFGNAGSLYKLGRKSKDAIEVARTQVATLFNCDSKNIIFTSGGSESNNTAVHSAIMNLLKNNKTDIIISAGEHDSIVESAKVAEQFGITVRIAPLSEDGSVNVRTLEEMITDDTGFISIMYVNNETGAVNDVDTIGGLCLKNNILFHVDCVQAAGNQSIDVKRIGCNFASISSHKIYGPKGVGALYIKNFDMFTPLIYGGKDQEFGCRGGTENVTGIVGFGKACQIAGLDLFKESVHTATLKQTMFSILSDGLKDRIKVNGPHVLHTGTGKILNIEIKDFDAENLILVLDTYGICISAGSACRSKTVEPSRVLTAMGLSETEARSSIRISFSKYNTIDEVENVAKTIVKIVTGGL